MTISQEVVTQLVTPVALVDVVLRLLHDMASAGHPGRDRTLAAARSKYYWPTMRIDVEKHISQCVVLKQKVLPLLPRFLNILFQLDPLTWLISTFYRDHVALKVLFLHPCLCRPF